jgi:hypothetical protein
MPNTHASPCQVAAELAGGYEAAEVKVVGDGRPRQDRVAGAQSRIIERGGVPKKLYPAMVTDAVTVHARNKAGGGWWCARLHSAVANEDFTFCGVIGCTQRPQNLV